MGCLLLALGQLVCNRQKTQSRIWAFCSVMTPGKILARIGKYQRNAKQFTDLDQISGPRRLFLTRRRLFDCGGLCDFCRLGCSPKQRHQRCGPQDSQAALRRNTCCYPDRGFGRIYYVAPGAVPSGHRQSWLVSERSSDTVGLALECHHLRRFGPLFSLSYRCLYLR